MQCQPAKEIAKIGTSWRMGPRFGRGSGCVYASHFDDVSQISSSVKSRKNTDRREPFEFMLRKAPEGHAVFLRKIERSDSRPLIFDHLVRSLPRA